MTSVSVARLYACARAEVSRISNAIAATWINTSVLVLMLCIDLVFILYSAMRNFTHQPISRWHIAYDGGFPEKWQYIKWGLLIALLLAIFRQRRSAIYLAWAALFTYFLMDDSMMIHERLGQRISDYFGFQPALRLNPGNFGEMIVSAGAAIPLLGFLAFCYVKSSSSIDRGFSRTMAVMLAALVFFGIFVDELDVVAPFRIVRSFLELVEDGGEMAVATVMVCYVGGEVFLSGRLSDAPTAGISRSAEQTS
jgi:hypothetical protein